MSTYSDYDFIQQIRSGELDVITWLSEQDEESIRDRLYSRLDETLDVSEGSYMYDALEPTNIEFSIAYFMLRNIILLAFPQYSFGEYLTLAAASKGVYRNQARYATGILNIEAEYGTIIPEGAKFSNSIPEGSDIEPKYYSVTKSVVISEQISEVQIKADLAGIQGNAKQNEINLNIQDIQGIISVTNPIPITNGIDEESDESLLDRLLERVRNPTSSGNKKDYIIWAKEVSGVQDAVCIPLWSGPGTVKVIIVGEQGMPIPELINEVKEYLDPKDHEGEGEGKAPIGAVVTVTTVETIQVKIDVYNIEIAEQYELKEVKEDIEEAIRQYILKINIGGKVRIRDVEDAIKHVDGIIDFGKVLLNGESINIDIEANLKASFGGVTFHE